MAFEEAEPKHSFTYHPDQVESIRKALQQYAEWVLTGEAFHNDYCVVVFHPEQEKVVLQEFVDYPTIHAFLEHALLNCEADEDIKDHLLTETLLFAFALRHPELKEEVVNTCKAFVTLARALNDSAEMWITCEEPFAINPLLLLSYVYPEYGYLLTAFYVPYWDDEHMPGPLYFISDWVNKFGTTDDTIKAFCYCDNSRVREIMLGYDSYEDSSANTEEPPFDLISYLRQSEGHYQHFLDTLVQRYQDLPYLPYTEDSMGDTNNPIADMALNMMFVHYPFKAWDDDFDLDKYFTQTFIHQPAEQEINEITTFVEQALGHAIIDDQVFKHNKSLLQYDPDQYVNNDTKVNTNDDPLANWKDFIIHALPDGANIWAYITDGSNKEVLSAIEKANIYRLADNGRYALYNELDAECFSMDSMWEDLKDILKPLYKKMVLWGFKNNISDTHTNEVFHRLVDVLFALHAQTPFTESFQTFICDYIGYISEETFAQRYATPWFNQLEHVLHQFGSYREFVERKHIKEFMSILLGHYKEAVEILPQKLLTIAKPEHTEEAFHDRINKSYGKIEIAVVAIHLLQYQQQLRVNDTLRDALRQYINTYTTGLFFYNLLEGTTFPRPDLLNTIKHGKTENMSHYVLEEYEAIKIPLIQLEQYIYDGIIKHEEGTYSTWESEQIAIAILDQYLECDRTEISERQKEYGWFSSANESTQKLLCVAHLASDLRGLACADVSARFLRLAFHFAPVRTSQLLSKTYKIDLYKLDNIDYMLDRLNKFTEQGLSSEGYWAYLLEEFLTHDASEKHQLFNSIVAEWAKGAKAPVSDSFIYALEQAQHNALVKGYELIPRNLQLEMLDVAIDTFRHSDLKTQYDAPLIDRILREMRKEKFTISDPLTYFKNRLQHEGHYCLYIEWDKWHDHPDIVKQLFAAEVEKPQNIKSSNYEEELYSNQDWKYIVLRKEGDQLVPFMGKRELWLIQQIYPNGENFSHCHTRLIIIDETCPNENLVELFLYNKQDYKQLVVEKTEAFLKNPETYMDTDVERFFRYGIYHYEFMGRSSYYDIDLEDIIQKVSWQLRAKTLRLLGVVSPDCLDIDMDMKPNAYYELLLSCQVDKQMILKYLLKKGLLIQIQHLSRKIDFSTIIGEEKLAHQMTILSCVAPIPEYHPLILKYENHKSAKMRAHIQALKDKFGINRFTASQFRIVDFGIYKMQGNTDPEAGSSNKVAQEPICLEQTEKVKAEIGMFVGFRFTAVDPTTVPKVIIHKVQVKHPVLTNKGEISYNTLEWTQNGYSQSQVFLGWHFENKEELIPGDYKLSAIDMDGQLIAEKTFVVEV